MIYIDEIVAKSYENRNQNEHFVLINLLKRYFITLSIKKIKLISFYLDVIKGETIVNS
jgi:hypothetical protein